MLFSISFTSESLSLIKLSSDARWVDQFSGFVQKSEESVYTLKVLKISIFMYQKDLEIGSENFWTLLYFDLFRWKF